MTTPSSGSPHPIETLHNVRDEIQRAAAQIEQRNRPDTGELNALGSAVVATLASLWQLSDVITRTLFQYSEQEIDEHTEHNDPVNDYRTAIDRAQHMRDILSIAFTDADQYWSAIERVHHHTSDDTRDESNDH